jgi:DNA primase (bacterial type)
MIKPDIIETIERAGFAPKQKGRAFWLSCPFHQDRTPSMKVDPERQTFHCFGCGAHGSVVDFIMQLHGLSFKDALVYLGIKSGQPVQIDPAIARQRKIQKDYETAINNLYEKLCHQSRELHKVRIQVKENPGALTDQGAAYFAGLMGKLAEIDFKIDTLIEGSFEDKIFLLRDGKYAYRGEIKSAAA